MTIFKQILKERYQGLPGIGISGESGDKGEKGRSIYIGYLKNFFDYNPISEPTYVYIREKNKTKNNMSSPEFYYRKDDNIYTGQGRIATYSLYNLHGIFFDKEPQGEESRADMDYKHIVQSDDFWKRKYVDEAGIPVKIKGFQYFGTNPEWTEEELRKWKRNNIDVDDMYFPVKLGEDYIESRNQNDEDGNYSVNAFIPKLENVIEYVVVPTNLRSIYHVGDILYILDDITGNIISYITITENMLGCSFSKFLEQDFTSCDSLKSTFNLENGRVKLDKTFYISDVNTNASEESDNIHFRKNFVKRLSKDYLLNIPYNTIDKDSDRCYIDLNAKNEEHLKIYQTEFQDELTEHKDNFVIKSKNLKMQNLFIKNLDTNINVNEYNDEEVKMIGEYKHLYPMMENGFVVSEENDTVTLKIKSNNFFVNNTEISEKGFYYGFELYKKESDNTFTLLKKLENNSDINEIEYRLLDEYFVNGTNKFGMITFVRGNGIASSYSKMSELEIGCLKTSDTFRITDYTFRQSTTSTSTSVDDDFDNDFCSFVVSDITCEKQDDANIIITSNNGARIKEIYFDNSNVFTNNTPKNFEGTWVEFNGSDMSLDDNAKPSRIVIDKIKINENLQDFVIGNEVVRPECIGECLYLMSINDYKIGQSIQETDDRNLIVTVITIDDETNNTYRSSFVFNQPGFSNPLNDVSVSFNSVIKNNKLEDANKVDNGILCNQIQTFTEVNYHSFNNDTWGKYFENPRIRVNVQLETETTIQSGVQTYCEETNYNNVHFYSKYDKDRYPNNAVKTQFFWMNGNQGISTTSNVNILNENSHEFSKYAIIRNVGYTDVIDEHSGWISINDQHLNRTARVSSAELTIPYDINYYLNEPDDGWSNAIGGEYGLTFDEVNNSSDKVKIRTFCEIANPIPMEFNFRWKVNDISIIGQLKEEYKERWRKFDPTSEVIDDDIVFEKYVGDDTETNGLSENVKLIINPVFMTLCPASEENQSELKGAVKVVGSDEGILLQTGICDIDQRTKDEFYEKGFYDSHVRYAKSKIIDSDNSELVNISDITNYFPKKKYLQDNITTLSVLSKDLRNCVNNETISIQDNPFLNLNTYLNQNSDNAKSRLNIYPIDWDDVENEEYEKHYIQLNFDAEYMNPLLRKGENNFYYNDKLYPLDNYNQWNTVSPLWVSVNLNNEILSSKEIESKQVWNYEYEVSPKYRETDVFGGVLTKSGNGYLNLVEDADYGQYESDKLLTLDSLKTSSESYILGDSVLSELSYPTDFAHQPEEGCFFRGLLFKADWTYPNFIKAGNDIKVYPYVLTNPFESYLDSLVMDNILECHPDHLSDYIKEKCKDTENIFTEGTDVSTYLEKKLKKGVWSSTNGQKTGFMPNANYVNMMIPYNLMFDVYPRTMYNVDAFGDVMNIVMLQQPNVIEDGHYEFDKRYFEIKDEDKSPILPPWNFNV